MRNFIILILFCLTTLVMSPQKIGLKVGDISPELSFKNPEGEILKLSNLRGKMVLIDFWASWCIPCRRENPSIVNAYKKNISTTFNNGEGLEIYSLSLDKNIASWVKAINDDELFWKYHVSDLSGWNSKGAAIYNIRSIPSNVLINGDGVIIARNLKGYALSRFLESQKK